MRVKRGWVVWLWLLLPAPSWADNELPPEHMEEGSPPDEGVPPPVLETESGDVLQVRRWHFLTRLEATTLMLLPRHGTGRDEGFLQLEPTLVVDGGEDFGLNLGAPVRLSLWGGSVGAGRVRAEDWDSLSDWGQVVRLLSLGSDASPVALWAGSLDCYSLLSGHLVRRYSNRTHPDYHPAGAVLTGTLGPLYTEAFVSDVLGARLMGAEVALDVQHVLVGQSAQPGRYTLSFSAVHEGARLGSTARLATLAHVDASAVVVVRRGRDSGFEAQVFAGWGGVPGAGGAWGAVAGLGADAVSPTFDLQARLEGRLQRGGFRQGYFGPDYELARFQVAGASGEALAEAVFPNGASAFGEVIVSWDAVHLGELLQRHLRLSLSAEAFTWGRVDADVRMAVQLVHRTVEVALRGMAVGLRQPGTRYLASGEGRWRFLGGRVYALGQGGTLLTPTPEGKLRPGAFIAVGMGVDHVR
ncbi:hypothetical protein OV208_40520 [Corallococcus sp. bb12-1]|uniref:hypothetical protein n=1 Tax=Corallococcus sp. bb12-1 TaxID=2996784 RepID=UPI00226D88B5|nr:hypothetical protein [Corallococcus sp. bb12-1]MCY1047653.1 hypothetical protein [Corallococcus sp. bb12-1]